MSEKVRDVSAEYRAAEARAKQGFDPGREIVDLPAIRLSCFVQGYAQCLIDHDILRKRKPK